MDAQKQPLDFVLAAVLSLVIPAVALWLFASRLGTQTPAAMLPLGWVLSGAAITSMLLALVYIRQLSAGAAWTDLALGSFFLLVLALPLLGLIAPSAITTEKRYFNKQPPIPVSLKDLWDYPKNWTAYFDDHFGWRSEMIYLNNLLKVSALQTSPSANVIIGRDGWLFFTGDNSMWDYQGLVPLGAADRQRIYNYLYNANQRLNEKDAAFLIVVAPNKQSVYPEYLPPSIRKISPQTRLDQLLEFNAQKGSLSIIDLRKALLDAKGKQLLYMKTDTHWNELGAFAAYQEIANALSLLFPQLRAHHPLKDYLLHSTTTHGGDLVALNNLRPRYTDTQITLIPRFPQTYREPPLEYKPENVFSAGLTVNEDAALPTAVIFHDSYGPFLKPFLAQSFRRAVYIRPYVLAGRNPATSDNGQTGIEPPYIDWEIVAREQPDVVILVLSERFLIHIGE